MNIWESTVLTDKGAALQAKLIEGQTLHITQVMTGGAKVPLVNLRQQTSVTDGGKRITLQPVRIEGHQMVVPVLLENTGLEESYDLWQVGIYAQDPDEGEILYCLAQATEAKHIPSAAEGPGFSITWDFYFKTSNTVPIEVNLNSKGLVSIEQYQVHEGEIHGLKGDVHELDGRLKELNADLNAINVDISTKETNLSKKSTGVKNLNNVIENGCFTINPDVTTECLPIYEWLTLLVMNSGFGGIIQIAFVVDGSKMFARTYNAGGAGWSEWRQVF